MLHHLPNIKVCPFLRYCIFCYVVHDMVRPFSIPFWQTSPYLTQPRTQDSWALVKLGPLLIYPAVSGLPFLVGRPGIWWVITSNPSPPWGPHLIYVNWTKFHSKTQMKCWDFECLPGNSCPWQRPDWPDNHLHVCAAIVSWIVLFILLIEDNCPRTGYVTGLRRSFIL